MSVSTVSATGIQDPTGQVFANGFWRLEFVPTYGTPGIYNDGGLPFTKQYGGSLDATGSFSQAGVNRNDTIAPAGSQWRFTAIPAVNGTTYSVLLNINTPAFDVTAAINAVITNIVVSPTSISRAYKDAELINVDGSGAIYYDETLKVLKVWDAATSTFLPLTPNNGSPTFNNLTVTGQALIKNLENIRFASDFATISAAIADLGAGGGVVYIPSGTYLDNIIITVPYVTLKGAGIGATIIKPANIANPVITIDATNAAGGALDSIVLEDFSVYPIAASSCDAGITIKGKTISNQPNDHHKFRHIEIGGNPFVAVNTTGTNNFRVGLEIIGRTIWSTFDNVAIRGTRGDGLKVLLTGGAVGPVSACSFNDCEFTNNYGYGINWNTVGAMGGSQAIEFTNCNIQFNSNNAAFSPAAGSIFQGIWSANLLNCSWEQNCAGVADANKAHLRLTGAVCRNFNIYGGTFTKDDATSTNYGIFADGNSISGTWTGLDFIGASYTKTIHVAVPYTGEFRLPIIIGTGFGMGAPEFIADSFGNSPAFSQYPWAPMIYQVGNAAFPVTANVVDLTDSNTAQPGNVLALVSGPNTINKITGATAGQILWLFTSSGAANTIGNAVGGAGQITLRDGVNRTLAVGDWLMLYSQDGSTWKEIGLGASLLGLVNTWALQQTFTTPIVKSGMQFNGATSGSTNLTPQPIAGSTSLLLPAANGTLAIRENFTATLKTGSGAGNYTSASTTYVRVDTTNLVFTVTIPTGFKLICRASMTALTITAAVQFGIALADGGADNTGILIEKKPISSSATIGISVDLEYIVNGDGASHTINLQYLTTNAADSVLIANGTATFKPVMSFLLIPSN